MKLLNAELCDTPFSRFRGLMFSKRKTLFFVFDKEQVVPLHMWFVFYRIDVIYLNEDAVVVEIKQDLKPFTFYTSKYKCKYIIETPHKLMVEVGDQIEI